MMGDHMNASPQVEIFGLDDKVHYRRPLNHPDVLEALRTQGYYVICPACKDGKLIHTNGILGCLCGFVQSDR